MASSAGSFVKSGLAKAFAAFVEYDTPKIVHIQSKKVGFINRVLQAAIITYIVVYVIWWKKGYQEFDKVVSATTTKLKGIAVTNCTELNITVPGGVNGTRIWDVADYVVPPQENDAFFVTTNIIITTSQTQGVCPEAPSVSGCSTDADCPAGTAVAVGDGVRTGRCVQSDVDPTLKACEIIAWCPVERDQLPLPDRALLEDSQHFTVLIKNYIEFPKFHKKRRNILDTQNETYLSNCRYNSQSDVDSLCPIFVLGDIVKETQATPNDTYNSIAVLGGVIVINIEWHCNLDYSIESCLPHYSFSRLDHQDAKIAKGSNFRYSSMYERDGKLYRDLFKAYGIRFIIKVSGEAGKFAIVPLLLNIGSGIGLLAIASIICDIVILYVLKKRHIYKRKKYLYVEGDDPYMSAQAQNDVNYDDDDDDDDAEDDDSRLAGDAATSSSFRPISASQVQHRPAAASTRKNDDDDILLT